jgi:hypothetical protein
MELQYTTTIKAEVLFVLVISSTHTSFHRPPFLLKAVTQRDDRGTETAAGVGALKMALVHLQREACLSGRREAERFAQNHRNPEPKFRTFRARSTDGLTGFEFS